MGENELMVGFIGRTAELQKLCTLADKPHASLCVLKGRRRIGKSRLLTELKQYFKAAYAFSGLVPEVGVSAQDQRDEFAKQLTNELGIPGIKADDWSDLFWHLAQHVKNKPVLIILDEITWMGDEDPTFLPKLKNAWDLQFSQNNQLVLAISGSLSTWIDENILSSTGFLGRVSLQMDLQELPLKDCLDFWKIQASKVGTFEKLKMLSVTGGVPRYLENIDPKLTAEENIRRLCFARNSLLSLEFKRVFSDLYDKRSGIYESIVRCLVDGMATQDVICAKTGMQRGGVISDYLDDLVRSGFLSRDHTWHIKSESYSKLSQYRIKDSYSRFYLKYIQPNLINIEQGNFDTISTSDLPSWHSMMGLQMENLIINNRDLIKQALQVRPADIVCDNPFFQRKTTRQKGCQIDYMIQTKFNNLYICEIKYSKNEITTKVIDEMQEKISRLTIPKNFSYRLVLIYVGEISEKLEESQYFDYLIDFTALLDQ